MPLVQAAVALLEVISSFARLVYSIPFTVPLSPTAASGQRTVTPLVWREKAEAPPPPPPPLLLEQCVKLRTALRSRIERGRKRPPFGQSGAGTLKRRRRLWEKKREALFSQCADAHCTSAAIKATSAQFKGAVFLSQRVKKREARKNLLIRE